MARAAEKDSGIPAPAAAAPEISLPPSAAASLAESEAASANMPPLMPVHALDVRTVYLGGLFLLALLAAFYVAAEILLPIFLAFLLKLVLQPVMRTLEKFKLPRVPAALLIILLLLGSLVGLGSILSGPAGDWANRLPSGIPKLQERLSVISKPIEKVKNVLHHAEQITDGAGSGKTVTVALQGTRLSDELLSSTRTIVSGILETILVLFFLLVSGDTFLRRLVEVLPRFQDKRQAVDISQQIERDISAYLATITGMNAAVGAGTALVMYFCGIADPILWGAAAFILNYIPILGPLAGIFLFFLVGLLTKDTLFASLLPASLYLCIHLIEGETLTPMLLARRFTLNPVLVILALIFWYWMWGVPGAILSTPLLAITKIICDRIQSLTALGHFIEG